MKQKKPTLESIYSNRRKRIIKQIKGDAAVFFSAPLCSFGRDQSHPFRQDADFFYLTGIEEPSSALVLLGKSSGPRSIIFLREREAEKERWNGEIIGLRRARRRFKVDEIFNINQLKEMLPKLVKNCQKIHHSLGLDQSADQLILSQLQSSRGPELNRPHVLSDARLLTAPLRLIKDRYEIGCIRHVTEITARSFLEFLPHLKELKSEKHGAQVLESIFARRGAHTTAFATIIASGRNATVLHHKPNLQPVWKRELVLIDAGASFKGYAGDITRTLPVSGEFTKPQADVYDVVHQALSDAIFMVRPGVTLEEIHQTAAQTLTKGLVKLKILRGSVAHLVQIGAYKPYFMHRIGHYLGLDVHDLPPIYHEGQPVPPAERPLEPGIVFTVEPGLYFDIKDETVPQEYRGIGIRIEEDILVTASGCEVLTEQMPSRRADIEAALSSTKKVAPV